MSKLPPTGWILLVGITLIGGSCSSKKFLQEEEQLIVKNEVKIEGQHLTSAEKTRLRDRSLENIPLKPNANFFFFFPKERSILKYRFAADTPSLAALIMRLDGEHPALVDSSRIIDITENLRRTIQSEGYYDATANYEIKYYPKRKKRKKEARVIYRITPHKIYRLDSFNVNSLDTALLSVVKSDFSNSLMQYNIPVTAALRQEEAKRITTDLRDQGYYDITPAQFTRFIASDTTKQLVDLDFNILTPVGDSLFHRYTIGDIHVYPGFDPDFSRPSYRDTLIKGYHFRTLDGNTFVKPKFIAQKIGISSGDIYTFRDFRKTLLQLNTLDIFTTPRIIIKKRDDTSQILDYHIQLSRSKKIEDQVGVDLFISSFQQGQALFGISLSGGRKIKNIFGGAETFSIDLDGSTETSFGANNTQNITTLGIGIGISTPRYKDWLSLGGTRLLPGLKNKLLTDNFMSDLNSLGEQYFSLQFEYEDFTNFYESTRIKLSRGVNLKRRNHSLNFVFQNLDLLSPSRGVDFDTIIGDNEVFKRSFTKQLITGIFFRSFNWQYNSPIKNKKSWAMYVGFESSGHEVALFNWITNNSSNSINFNGEKFQFSQFLKMEIEPKFYHHFNSKSTLAFRLGMGVAWPFSDSTQVPYNELFSLGGAYSLRAWKSRAVGPGGDNNSTALTPFAADQFKFELTTEYRFDLGWIMEGAIFGELGNVWALKSNSTEPVAFAWDRYAVDGGLGLRFDLTFFLFRIDLAFPFRNWYPDPVDGSHWNLTSFKDLTQDYSVKIGINYPF